MNANTKLFCPSCQRTMVVGAGMLGAAHRRVRCPYCQHEWRANKDDVMIVGKQQPSASDLERMPDGDYHEYQANQARLKKFRNKLDIPIDYRPSQQVDIGQARYRRLAPRHQRVDWVAILSLLLGIAIAIFIILTMMVIFRNTILSHLPAARGFYIWLADLLGIIGGWLH